MWIARIDDGSDYGVWVPTGCTDKDDAIEYMTTHYRLAYDGKKVVRVKEWMKL